MVRTLCLAVTVALLAAAGPAGAVLTRARTVEQLAADADAIVRGRVVEQSVEMEPETGRVRTFSTVEVSACLRGDDATGSRVVISQIGGTVGDVTVVASGAAPLAVGQDVLLFLRGKGTERRAPVGMARGVWFVHRGDDGVERLSPERPAPPDQRARHDLPRLDEMTRRVLNVVHPPR